jgi:PAS domain S-box-containing protein
MPQCRAAWLDAMPHAVWLVDPKPLRIVDANDAAARLLGTRLEDVRGRPVLDFAASPEDEAFWLSASEPGERTLESDTLVRRADGAVVPVTRRVSRLPPGDGAAFYVVGLEERSATVQRERELSQRVAELESILESLLEGILVTDLRGRIINFNRRFSELWEIPEEMLHGEPGALLDWMQSRVVDPTRYLRRLAVLEDAAMLRASDIVVLQSGRILERVSLPQCSHHLPIGRVFAFREIRQTAPTPRPVG